MPSHHNVPVSSNVSHQTEKPANSSASANSCLRDHICASSAQSKSDSEIALRPLTLKNRKVRQINGLQAAPMPARPLTAGKTLTDLRASPSTAPVSRTRKPPIQRSHLQSAVSVRFGCALIGKLVGTSPKDASCTHGSGTVKCSQLVHFARRALLANQSLNRTFCCGRPLAIISFLAKAQPPQNAG